MTESSKIINYKDYLIRLSSPTKTFDKFFIVYKIGEMENHILVFHGDSYRPLHTHFLPEEDFNQIKALVKIYGA